MLTTPSTLKGDPRVMYGLLATTSLRLINEHSEPSTSEVFEASLLRLLEIYEYNAFRSTSRRRAILIRASVRRTRVPHPTQDLSDQVRQAIRAAHMALHPKMNRAAFCALLSDDVRACFGNAKVKPAELSRRRARLRRFLTLVKNGLPQ